MPKRDTKAGREAREFSLFDADDPLTINPSVLEKELLELLGTETLVNDDLSSEEIDEDDPRLLAELESFVTGDDVEPKKPQPALVSSGTAVLDEINHRVAVYYSAIESLRSIDPVDSSRITRYERVIEELGALASRISSGDLVCLDDLPPLPPPVVVDTSGNAPQALTVNTVTTTTPDDSVSPLMPSYTTNRSRTEESPPVQINPSTAAGAHASSSVVALKKRCQEYKLAAVQARDRGQIARAKELLMASKFIEEMLPKVESGEEPFDPDSDMPPPPDEFGSVEEEENVQPPKPSHTQTANTDAQAPPSAMLSPVVTAENLQLRAEYYRVLLQQANANPADASKARRYARVLAQYENATKAFQHGVSTFDYSELPPPPNCPKLIKRAGGGSAITTNSSATGVTRDVPSTAADGRKQRMVTLLKARQADLKAAALTAKESGNMDLAKTHLRAALSINPMIQSVEAGIPFDLSQLPKAPSSGPSKAYSSSTQGYQGPVITGVTCDPPMQLRLDLEAATGESDRNRIILGILKSQITEATERAEELSRAGLTELSEKLRELAQFGQSSVSYFSSSVEKHRPISYTFEWANIPRLNMNHDLGDNILEVCIKRGITLPVPSDLSGPDKVDTQVELQVPFPSSENPQRHSTEWIKHTCEPTYDSVARFQVETRSRSFQFSIKNNRTLKACVYYSRGIFRRPGLLGTASIPLGQLAHDATVTHLADLMDGRKAVGGRLEVRIRQRSAASGPQMASYRKPWLLLNLQKSSHASPHSNHPKAPATSPIPSHGSSVVQKSPTRGLTVEVKRTDRGNNRNSPQSTSVERSRTSPNISMSPNEPDTIYSLEVLKDDKLKIEQRLSYPELQRTEREKNQSNLVTINRLIEGLERRLDGKNSEVERERYAAELHTLATETRRKYDNAKAHQDSAQMSRYKYRLGLITRELEKYSYGSSNAMHVEGHNRTRSNH